MRLTCWRWGRTLQKFVAFVASVLFLSPDAARLRASVTLWLGAAAVLLGSGAFSTYSSREGAASPRAEEGPPKVQSSRQGPSDLGLQKKGL